MLASSLFTKICSFITSLILIRILSTHEFGLLSYVLSALTFFIPFSGGGIQHSFLRYAPMLEDKENRIGLFNHSLFRGLLFSFFLAFVLFLLMPWLNSAVGNTSIYFSWLIFYLFSFFLIELVKMRYRVADQNKTYAGIDVYLSVLVLFFESFRPVFGILAVFWGRMHQCSALEDPWGRFLGQNNIFKVL